MTTDRGQDFGSILQRKTILGPRAAWEPGKQLPNLQRKPKDVWFAWGRAVFYTDIISCPSVVLGLDTGPFDSEIDP